ncbi:MAG: cold-shock protein [Chloroflexota bacterium]
MKGYIRRLRPDRGFGFIKTAEGIDIFFHRNHMSGSVFDSLEEGQWVVFDVDRHVKGLRATNVQPIKATEMERPPIDWREHISHFCTGKDSSRARRRAHLGRERKALGT